MADTTYLKKTVEPFIVDWVSRRIGIPLKPTRAAVGKNTDGQWVHFAFDGVSDDQRVGLLVSTSNTVKPGGIRKLHVDASVLLQVPFSRRFMAFVSDDVCRNFLNKCDGLLPLRDIEMLVCNEIPAGMIEEIQKIQSEARKEVGDKGKIWKPGGKRR